MEKNSLQSLKSLFDEGFTMGIFYGNYCQEVYNEDEIELVMHILTSLPNRDIFAENSNHYERLTFDDFSKSFLSEDQIIKAIESFIDKDILFYTEEEELLELHVPNLYSYLEKEYKKYRRIERERKKQLAKEASK